MVSLSLPGSHWLEQHFFRSGDADLWVQKGEPLFILKLELPGVHISLSYASVHRLAWRERNIFTPGPAGPKHNVVASKHIILLIAGLPDKTQPLLATGKLFR